MSVGATPRQSRNLLWSGTAATVAPVVAVSRGPGAVRVSQPQQAVGVNWANPLARGLIGAVNAAGPYIQDGSSGIVKISTDRGLAFESSASQLGYVNSLLPAVSGATLLYFGNYIAASPNHVAAIGTLSGGNQLFTIDSGGAAPNGARAVIRTVNAGLLSSAEFDSTATGYPISVFVATYNGSQVTAYRNGIDVTASRNNTSATGNCSDFNVVSLGGSKRGTNTYAASGTKGLLAVGWNRALSAAEIAAVSANPWQLFAPAPANLWVPYP